MAHRTPHCPWCGTVNPATTSGHQGRSTLTTCCQLSPCICPSPRRHLEPVDDDE